MIRLDGSLYMADGLDKNSIVSKTKSNKMAAPSCVRYCARKCGYCACAIFAHVTHFPAKWLVSQQPYSKKKKKFVIHHPP